MKKHGNYFLMLLPILVLVAGSALAGQKNAGPNHGAPKDVTECGTILTEPGNYKLANDLLDCPGQQGVAIFGSDITLNLKGHLISCANDDVLSAGVLVFGDPGAAVRNVTVKNGHVANCVDGIVLVFTEDAKIMNISSTGNHKLEGSYGTGITLFLSSNNVIMHNHTFDNESHGIGSWESSGNLFKHNTSTGNGSDGDGSGISLIAENHSRIMCNRTHGNVDGILMESGGDGNLVRGNLVSGNQRSGLGMLGFHWQDPDSGEEYYYDMPSGNTIRSNIVEDSASRDLFEAHFSFISGMLVLNPDGICRNTWEKNQFQTETSVAGCIGIPVELEEEDVCALHDDYDD